MMHGHMKVKKKKIKKIKPWHTSRDKLITILETMFSWNAKLIGTFFELLCI
jgi:hypothetical protein